MYIIVGLGNYGDKYKYTKHNTGFITLDYLADKHNISITKNKHKALFGEGVINGEKVILAKPQTYMNSSGECVYDLMDWYKADIDKLIIIYDDVDLDVGKIRIRPKGSAGSHNGMKSIIYLMKSEDFLRIRIGIGKQPQYMDLADYVMSKFNDEEIPLIKEAIDNASSSIGEIIKSGLVSAMNKYSG